MAAASPDPVLGLLAEATRTASPRSALRLWMGENRAALDAMVRGLVARGEAVPWERWAGVWAKHGLLHADPDHWTAAGRDAPGAARARRAAGEAAKRAFYRARREAGRGGADAPAGPAAVSPAGPRPAGGGEAATGGGDDLAALLRGETGRRSGRG